MSVMSLHLLCLVKKCFYFIVNLVSKRTRCPTFGVPVRFSAYQSA